MLLVEVEWHPESWDGMPNGILSLKRKKTFGDNRKEWHMDIWSKKKRSQVMSRILGKDTKPELAVRKLLCAMGYRFRLHGKGLPGKPDIILKKFKTVIFVHGCFWHLHDRCRDGTMPKTSLKYWAEKLRGIKNVTPEILENCA